jgi:isopentenyl-diphosphate delta-isomerase
MSAQDPLILVVDENDQPVGAEARPVAQKYGLYHRIARLVLEDPDGNILLAKRGSESNYYPNCWGESVAGHVDEGEDYLDAIKRETGEEIGITSPELHEIAYYPTSFSLGEKILNRFNKVFRGQIPADTKFTLEKPAVAEVRWFTKQEVKDLISEHPDQVTEALIEIFNRVYS